MHHPPEQRTQQQPATYRQCRWPDTSAATRPRCRTGRTADPSEPCPSDEPRPPPAPRRRRTWSASRPGPDRARPARSVRRTANIRMLSNSRNRVVTEPSRRPVELHRAMSRPTGCSARSAFPRSRLTSAPTAAARSGAEGPGEHAEAVEQGGGRRLRAAGGTTSQPFPTGCDVANARGNRGRDQHVHPGAQLVDDLLELHRSGSAPPPAPAPAGPRPTGDRSCSPRPSGRQVSACRRRAPAPGTAEPRRLSVSTTSAGGVADGPSTTSDSPGRSSGDRLVASTRGRFARGQQSVDGIPRSRRHVFAVVHHDQRRLFRR